MTTTKIKLRPSSVIGNPDSVIYTVTKGGDTRVITSKHKLFPYEWDYGNSSVIPSSDERLKSIDRHISHDIRRLKRIISNLEEGRRNYTAEDVVTEYHRVSESGSFFQFMGKTIQRHLQWNHKGTVKNYRATLESFRQFRLDEDVDIADIDKSLIEDYEEWLHSKRLTRNTISFYMRILRAVYNRAVDQELTKDRKPFRNVFTGMEKTRKRAISTDDLKRIHDLNLAAHPHLEFARDIFFFLFYCRGMSFVDAAYLRKSNISGGILSYRRSKTNQLLHIKVEPEMWNIIIRHSKRNSLFLLPLIRSFGNDRTQYESALHKINRALKEIGMMAKLSIPLSTYVSRHSWATIAKNKNVPLPIISEALGHDSETTTMIYLSSIDPSTIDKVNSMIISGL